MQFMWGDYGAASLRVLSICGKRHLRDLPQADPRAFLLIVRDEVCMESKCDHGRGWVVGFPLGTDLHSDRRLQECVRVFDGDCPD